jgi:hypothetical protein
MCTLLWKDPMDGETPKTYSPTPNDLESREPIRCKPYHLLFKAFVIYHGSETSHQQRNSVNDSQESRELLQLKIWKIDRLDGVRISRYWGS